MVSNSSCACVQSHVCRFMVVMVVCAVERLNHILASLHVEKIHKQLDNNKTDTNKGMDVGVDNWNVGVTLFC